ncbi:unnamed protein product, partial [Vitis vinifera]|uniref:Uncharacterized protein n=1 Tax=Vitis vinifera TaxID=29760 RepID=D7TTN8_VITVI
MTGKMGCSILISVDSATSMANGDVVVRVSSKRMPPFVNVQKRHTPCITEEVVKMVCEMGGKKERGKKKNKKKGKKKGVWECKKKKEDGGIERK